MTAKIQLEKSPDPKKSISKGCFHTNCEFFRSLFSPIFSDETIFPLD
jgi:hypothetical protein